MRSMKRVVSGALLAGVLLLSTWLIGGCARLTADLPGGPPIFGDDFPRIPRDGSEQLLLALQEVIRISPEGLGTLERSISTSSASLRNLYREYWEQFEKDPAVREDFFDQLQQEHVPFLNTQVEGVQVQRTPLEPTAVARGASEISLTAQLPYLTNYDAQSATWLVTVGPQSLNALDVIWNQILTEMIFRALYMESLPGRQQFALHRETRFELPKGATLVNRQELERSQWHLDFGGGTSLKATLKVEDHAVTVVEDLVQTEAEPTNLMTEQGGAALFDTLGKYKAFVIKYSQDPQVAISVTSRTVTPQRRPDQFSRSWQATFRSPSLDISFDGLPRGGSLTLSTAASFTLGSFIGWRFSRNGRLEWFDANITVNPAVTVTNTVGLSAALFWNKKKKAPWEPKTDIWFWIGWLPVVIRLQAELEGTVELGTDGTTTLGLRTNANINSRTGVLFDNGIWRPIWSHNIGFNLNQPSISSTSTFSTCTISVGPEITVGAYIYYLAGPFARLRTSLDSQLRIRPSRTWQLHGTVKASGGFKTSTWLTDFLGIGISLSYDFFTWKWPQPPLSGTW